MILSSKDKKYNEPSVHLIVELPALHLCRFQLILAISVTPADCKHLIHQSPLILVKLQAAV